MLCLGHRGGVREVRLTGMAVVMLPISVGGFREKPLASVNVY